MNLIRKIDYLSYETHLTLNENGDKIYKTIIGGILSLMSIIFSFGFSCYIFHRLLYKKDAKIITSIQKKSNVTIFNSDKFPFLFRLSDSYSNKIPNENLFNVSLYFWYSTYDSEKNEITQKYEKVKTEKCDIDKHFGEYKHLFNNIPDLKTFFCPIERLTNQTITGIYGDHSFFSYYSFYLSKCINSTENNNTCYQEETIEKFLSHSYLDVKFLSYSIDSLNLSKTTDLFVYSDRYSISGTIYKKIWFFFNKVEYITDNGLFFPSNSIEKFHQFDRARIDVDLRNLNNEEIPGTFLVGTILNSGNLYTYNRSYLKVQDYLATIGGIIKVFSFLCQCINYYNSKNSYYRKIIKDFIIENQIKKKNNYKSESGLEQSDVALKNSFYTPKQVKSKFCSNKGILPIFQKSNTFIVEKMKDKEKIDNKFKRLFLPLSMTLKSKQDKIEFYWYIKIINEKLNVIHVLNILEQMDKLRKEFDISNVNSFGNSFLLSNQNNYKSFKNNYIYNTDSSKKKNHV